jgi:hypothetical protein
LPILAEWQNIDPNNPELLAYLEEFQDINVTEKENENIPEARPSSPTSRQYRLDQAGKNSEIIPIRIPHVSDAKNTESSIYGDS